MNLWKRDEPKIDEKSWLFDSSSSLSKLSTISKQNPSAYGTCRDGMLNDQEVDKGVRIFYLLIFWSKLNVEGYPRFESQRYLTIYPTPPPPLKSGPRSLPNFFPLNPPN
ncbi:unnamed protein product [Meloidogyne enterolobii]|uniref:Uncharacterized protein n=1 Tax=Meloidogyne enterolobii TaxID=390850 RepID=A0ACB1AM51_MELEN